MFFISWKPAFRRLLFLCSLALTVTVYGGDFYSARVPVAEGDEAETRDAALAEALKTVVTKVTGSPQAAASPMLQQEFASAARYVTESRFIDVPGGGRQAEVSFEPSAVDAMLRRYGLGPRDHRPAVLVWLGDADQLLPADDESSWMPVNAALSRHGLILLRPLMDLEDQTRLTSAELARRSGSRVREASVRYSPDVMLSASVTGGDGQWQADWMLLSGELTRRWSTRSDDRAMVLSSGIDDAAGMIAELFPAPDARPLDLSLPASNDDTISSPLQPATTIPSTVSMMPGVPPTSVPVTQSLVPTAPVLTTGAGQILVRVSGIRGPADYRRAMGGFEGNSAVSAVEVAAVESDAVILAVTPSTDQASLVRSLEEGGVMSAEASGASPYVSRGISLHYRLKP